MFDFVFRSYNYPVKPSEQRLMNAGRDFFSAVVSYLKSKTLASIYIDMELDVWRFIMHNKGIPSQHKGHMMYEKDDFVRFGTLPSHWYYVLNEHGEGTTIDFPVKAKPVLSWTASHYIVKNGKLEMAPKIPIEKVCMTIPKKACNVDNILT